MTIDPPPGRPPDGSQRVPGPPPPPTGRPLAPPPTWVSPPPLARRRGPGWGVWVALVLVGVAGIGLGTLLPSATVPAPVRGDGASGVAAGDRAPHVVSADERTPEQLAADVGDAVWRVDAEGCGGAASGTAFAVDDHHLVTNWHVTVMDPTPRLTSRDGTTIDGEVIGWTPHPDVALIRVAEPLPDVLPWVGADELGEGQVLVAMGYPVPYGAFSVSPVAILSFVEAAGVRGAIRGTGVIDSGNSGGPALTLDGEVAGIVTEVEDDPGAGVAIAYTHDRVADALADFTTAPEVPEADCEASAALDEAMSIDAYGDDGTLDILWDGCAAGDLATCDTLYWSAPLNSRYEEYGSTCGGRWRPTYGDCASMDR